MSEVSAYWSELHRRRVSRRALLKASGRAGVGAAGLALVGCGGDDDEDEAADDADVDDTPVDDETPDSEDGDGDVAEPPVSSGPSAPVRGGVAHFFAATEIHDRWDPHRSRYSQTQSFHSLMYNRLIRFSSVSEGTLEGDLAGLPETPDEVTHIFRIRSAARFWDREPTNGRLVVAEDVRFNIQRQIDGRDADDNPDLLFFRQADYRRTASMEIRDLRTIVLMTDAPDATYLASVHAGPWGWITSPEAVEEYGDRWRDETVNVELNSGSGPYEPISFVPGGDLTLRRSRNQWRGERAFLDAIVLRRTSNQSIGVTYRTGGFDRADFPLSKAEIESLRSDFPEHPQHELPIDTPIQLSYLLSDDPESPLSDPRVGQAMSLAIDRFELIDRIYAGDGRISGPVPWYLRGWAIDEEELLTKPGYRRNKEDDLADIQLILAAAGGAENIAAIPLIVPDIFESFFPGIAENVKVMLERNLGIEVTTDFQSYEAIFAGLQDGTLPSFLGWGAAPRQADPTDQWLRSVHSDGAENWGRYNNSEVDALLETMRETLELGARQKLGLQVQDLLLETGYWSQNVANGIQLGISQPYLHMDPRAIDFAWSMHHLDSAWIDSNHEDYPQDRIVAEFPVIEPEETESPVDQSTADQSEPDEAGSGDADSNADGG